MEVELFETDIDCEEYFQHDNYALIKREYQIMQYIQNIFQVQYKCKYMVLSSFFFFVLMKIGFTNDEIININNEIIDVKHLSYNNLKKHGFSNDKIQALFYLLDEKKSKLFFKQYVGHKYNTTKADIFEECTICCDTFLMDEEIIKLTCNHMFHMQCIMKWHSNCPYCRKPFTIFSEVPLLIEKWQNHQKYAFAYLKLIERLLRFKRIPITE